MTHIQRTVSVVALLVVPVISRAQILAKVHALSLAGGCMVPGRDAVLNRVLSLRLADVEAGARLTSAYGVTARVVAIDAFPSYYYGWPEWPSSTLGFSVVRSSPSGSARHTPTMAVSVIGSNAWGILGYSSVRFVGLHACASFTYWAVTPAVEIGWQREWTIQGSPPSGVWLRHDCAFLQIRVGLGGWYEITTD